MRILSIFIVVQFAILSNFSIKAYNPIPNGLYACPDLFNVGIMVEDSIMTIYENEGFVFDQRTFGDDSIVDKCKIVPQGCGFFEISTVMPIDNVFSDIKISQSHVDYLPTDSVVCQFVFPEDSRFAENLLRVKSGLRIKTCEIDKNTIEVGMPRENSITFSFLRGIFNARLDDYAMGKYRVAYGPIDVADNFIKIELPNFYETLFMSYNIQSEYIKQIHPRIFKWRGYMFVRFADTSDLKRYK